MNDVTMHETQAATASALGFRRIDHVSMVVDDHGTTAEVTGVTHRYPRTIRVPLHTANRLINEGVPRRVLTRTREQALQSQVLPQSQARG